MCTRRFNKPRAAFAIIANFYSETAAPNPQIDLDRLEMATDQAIAACGGDARNERLACELVGHIAAVERQPPFTRVR